MIPHYAKPEAHRTVHDIPAPGGRAWAIGIRHWFQAGPDGDGGWDYEFEPDTDIPVFDSEAEATAALRRLN